MVEQKEEVVISGIGGWFPESNSVDEFRELLFSKTNGITIDSRRWNPNRLNGLNGTGKMKCINKYDSIFFSTHIKLAESMDPLTKIVLERSIEAIIDAGLSPIDLFGTNTGVFTGSAISESEMFMTNSIKNGSFFMLGNSRTMQANRVSYILNLTGPSYTMDSGWTCGSTGLQEAKDMIQKGILKSAIVGVTNINLKPEVQLQYHGLNRLNLCDQTKPFSDNADGYNRSESCIVMFLQKASEAKRSYGTLLNVKTQQFGDHQNHITNHENQHFKSLLLDCYNEAKIDPASVEFVEAYGSGIKQEDEMELNVMEEIFCNKNRTTPLKVGSVKSNVGHSEPCAFFMSIVKAIIAFESGYIPPNINYTKPNENVRALKSGKIQVVTEKTPFKGDVIGITGFGLMNSFSHVILKRNPKEKICYKEIGNNDSIPRLLLVSGRNEENAKAAMKMIKSHGHDMEYITLVNDVFSKNINAHYFRTFSILPETEENRIDNVWNVTTKKRPIWFVFSGMGSQWQGMGTHLLKIPMFADSINKIDPILKPLGIDIINILTNLDPKIFDNILNSFVGIAAIQIGLVDILKALDIKPNGYIGHSVGELGCAYADGCLTAEEMILSAYARGRASVETELIKGMMAAIGLGYEQIKNRLPHDVDVACHNSAKSCTISGPVDSVNAFVADLKSEGIFAKSVNVANIAYHSRYIKPAAPTLLKYLKEEIKEPKKRSSKWISSSIHESKWDTELAQYSSPEYLTNNLLSSVLFEDALKHIPSDAVVIEIAPHGLLQAILNTSLSDTVKNIPLTKRGHADSVRFLLTAIGNMYANDINPKIQALYAPITFPVSRGTPSIHNLPLWEHSAYFKTQNDDITNLGELRTSISLDKHVHLFEYKLHGRYILPISFVLCEVWKFYVKINDEVKFTDPIQFQNLHCDNNVEVLPEKSTDVNLMIQKGTGNFEFNYNNKVIFSGEIKFFEDKNLKKIIEKTNLNETVEDFQGDVPKDDIYDIFENGGYELGENFKLINKFGIYKNRIQGNVQWKNDWIYFLDALLKFSMVENIGLCPIEAPVSIGNIIISPQAFKNIINADIQVNYNLMTKEIKCVGVLISQIKNAPILLPETESKNIELEEKAFIPFNQLRCKNIDEFINYSIDIVMEQDDFNLDTVSRKVVLCHPYHYNDNIIKSCTVAIKEILENKSINNKTLNWDDVGYVSKNDELERYITVTHADYLKDTTKALINKKWSYIITCSKKEIRDVNHKEWKIITQQHFDDGHYIYLLKRVILPKENSIFIKSSCVDTSMEIWTSIENSKLSNEIIYVVLNKVPSEGFTKYVSNTIKKYQLQNLRFLFILDKNAPDLEKQKSFYVDQLSKGLTINIYKNGEWGTYRHMFVQNIKKNMKMTENIINPVLTFNKQNKIAIKYIGMNFKDLVFDDTTENEFGPIEYSGLIGADKKIMGFASLKKISNKGDIDTMFSWPVPVTWSFEDAATVPLSYALAYYTLKVLSNLTTDKSMLITSGLHPIGQAAISIALAEKCNIYVLVESTEEANSLSGTFSTLPRSNIIINTNNKFDITLKMLTKSCGIDIVLNFLAGEGFHSAIRVLAKHAKFFHFTKSNMKKQESIGTRFFLLDTSLTVVTSDMLLNESESNKIFVNKAFRKGLAEGVVHPFKRNVISLPFECNKVFTNMRTASRSEKVLLSLDKDIDKIKSEGYNECVKFKCHSNHTYVIIGHRSDWLDLADWLVDRGAQKIILLIKRHLMSTITCRRVDKLISRNVAIVIESDSFLSKRKDVVNWLKITSSSHDLGSLFMINQCDKDKIDNLRFAFEECSSKTKSTSFISISSNAEHVCAELKSIGFNAINISWNGLSQKSENLQHLLLSLDTLIINSNSMVSSSFICSEKVSDTSKNTRKLTQYYLSYFPETVDELHYLSEKLMRETSFVEVETNSPRYSELKGVLPVFIIPGFKPNVIEMFYKRLCYPAFEARFSEDIGSIDDLSKVLVNKIKSITGKNSVSLIGECWGGIVALKMAQMLEAEGIMVTLSLLEGDPQILFGWAQHCLTNDIIDKSLISMYSTDELHENSLRIYDVKMRSFNKRKEEITLRTLKIIRSRLQALVETRPLSNKLLTKVLMLKNVKEFELKYSNLCDYCVNLPSVYSIDELEYKNMLVRKETNQFISNHTAPLNSFEQTRSLNTKYENFLYQYENVFATES